MNTQLAYFIVCFLAATVVAFPLHRQTWKALEKSEINVPFLNSFALLCSLIHASLLALRGYASWEAQNTLTAALCLLGSEAIQNKWMRTDSLSKNLMRNIVLSIIALASLGALFKFFLSNNPDQAMSAMTALLLISEPRMFETSSKQVFGAYHLAAFTLVVLGYVNPLAASLIRVGAPFLFSRNFLEKS